jgi:uncharacterized membrane protein YeaQ/YmgE (transglycosylase-associated protein family)
MVDVNVIALFFTSVIIALAWGLIGFFSSKVTAGAAWDPRKLIATIIYSIILGIIGAVTGAFTLSNPSLDVFTVIDAKYFAVLVIVNKIMDAFWAWIDTKTSLAKASGGDIQVAFDVLPKGFIKVGDRVVVTDINHNMYMVDFGDGVVWGWEATDAPYLAYHEYKKPGKYTIRGMARNGSLAGYSTFEITVYGKEPDPVTPTPEPVKGYWAKLMDSIVAFLRALIGH